MLEHDIRALEQKVEQLIERHQALQLQNQFLKEEQLKVKRAVADLEKKKQELAYYYGAIHTNCIGCHKKLKQEKKSEKAPVACTQCHPKVAKK